MDFQTLITIAAGIATITGLAFTIINWKQRKKQESVTNNTFIIQQNNIVADLTSKIILDIDKNEFIIREIKRIPLNIFGHQMKKSWFMIGLLCIIALITLNGYFFLNSGFKHPFVLIFTDLFIPIIFFFLALILIYTILHYQKILVSKWFFITNYNGKLYSTDYRGKCHCGGKIKIAQQWTNLKASSSIICQANKNHHTSFDPNIFNEDKYVKAQ